MNTPKIQTKLCLCDAGQALLTPVSPEAGWELPAKACSGYIIGQITAATSVWPHLPHVFLPAINVSQAAWLVSCCHLHPSVSLLLQFKTATLDGKAAYKGRCSCFPDS